MCTCTTDLKRDRDDKKKDGDELKAKEEVERQVKDEKDRNKALLGQLSCVINFVKAEAQTALLSYMMHLKRKYDMFKTNLDKLYRAKDR